jgi:hypothetical protein
MSVVQQHLDQLRLALLSSRNADGGWGYHAGKASRLEPTCWALLALASRSPDAGVLRNWPAAEGLLLERAGGSSNFAFHALALLTLQALRVEHAAGNGALTEALRRAKGEVLPQSEINRQNNSLQGWSWLADTFSWVEPTAWALLALKRCAGSAGLKAESNRIEAAEELLSDRCCRDGGWNYGNSNMLGQELKPFIPPTAVALLSLRDRGSVPAVRRSVDFLNRAATTERSGVALSLALLALAAFGRPASDVRAALLQQVPTTLEFGNRMAAAMSLFALGAEETHAALFV